MRLFGLLQVCIPTGAKDSLFIISKSLKIYGGFDALETPNNLVLTIELGTVTVVTS